MTVLLFPHGSESSLYFSQDNRSGKILHLTRPHQEFTRLECFDIDKNLNFSPDNRSCIWIFFTNPAQILPAKTDGLVTFTLSGNPVNHAIKSFSRCEDIVNTWTGAERHA